MSKVVCKVHAGDFSLDDAPWVGRPVKVDNDQIETLIENNRCYTMQGDSQYTQNIQINKVIGENEKCVFYFMDKTKQTFWPTQYTRSSRNKACLSVMLLYYRITCL